MTLDDLRNIGTIIGVLVTVITFFRGLFEYKKQGSQKRSEHFHFMRKKLKENDIFKKICKLLENDDIELRNVSFADKRDFLGLFEEVALMVNSGIINKKVAHYMFGYYAILCWKSEYFWITVNKKSFYWRIFREFAMGMIAIENKIFEKNYKFNNNDYKF